MIGIASTADEDERNEYGMPVASIRGGERSPITGNIDQSVNKALPWVAFSWFLSGGAVIGLIMMALLMPQIIEAQVAKGVAQAKAEMAQQAATANAAANESRVHARIALDKVEDFRAKLAEKGINVNLDGH